MIGRAALLTFVCVACASCGGSPSSPSADAITGSERFGWDQPAADAADVASFRFAIYVDDARTEVPDASCAPGQSSGRFACTAGLPAMSAGTHALQVAAFVLDGGVVRESARSTAVHVVKR